VANVRNDWQWKQARLLVTAFDLLVFESLNIKAMHQLWGRKVGDLGFTPVPAQNPMDGHQAW
jgi:putative transposase